jgi:hypothetical protein
MSTTSLVPNPLASNPLVIERQASLLPTPRVSLMVATCTAAMLVAGTLGATNWDGSGGDAAAVVPLLALFTMALAVVYRCPDPSTEPVRPVGPAVAGGLAVAAGAIGGAIVMLPDVRPDLFGPAVSVATIGTFLGLWGLRSPALLRNVALLGALTWAPVAGVVHRIASTSLELPSEMVYRRIATMPIIGVADEPWRMHTAVLHRGALVVITVFVLGFAAGRWRFGARTAVDVVVAAFAALVAHHAVVLASPIDEYAPDDAARVASHPLLEVGIGIAAVALLAVLRSRRDHPVAAAPGGSVTAPPGVEGRDPFIFDAGRAATPLVTSMVLLTTAAPFWALATLLAI